MDQLSIQDDADAQWLAERGVPSFEEPFLQKYLQGRDALINQEKKQRSDHAFRETLSPMAREACAIVSAIRFEEQQTLWTKDYEDSLASDSRDIYPGMMFTLARPKIEQSKLWKIVKKMPKGALLHCHLEAMVNMDWLIEEAFNVKGMHIQAGQPLDSEDAQSTVPFVFKWLKNRSAESSSIWDKSYAVGQWIPIDTAADAFPHGGRKGFEKWLKERITITLDESVQHMHGPNDIWRKFQSCFGIISSLLHYEPTFRTFLRRMFEDLVEDGVQYVDIRSTFLDPFYKEGSEEPEPNNELMIDILDEEVENFKALGKGFWGARLIYTTLRSFDSRKIIESMQECIDMKILYPELICGFDLVGQEDLGRSLADLTPELFWFKKACAQNKVDIPFYFHAGETLGDGDETDENLFDAILLGTRRIGHAFSLYKHPLLVDMVKEKKILIESCPISNEVLRLTGSIMSHPLPALLARGVPVSLCNDDPAILGHGHSGMTHDFWQALQGWENLGLEGLASLAENSVRWASFEDLNTQQWQQELKDGAYGKGERAKRMQQWAKDFEKFCQWVVIEFGEDQDLNPEE
ncbi:Metallo-dependent hydrolase, partial [Aureobasidium melanogenum]|uniref:adenosine deaminase n=1 Tax=Aureobasidium melanogenum (strain CBS 110374) TaxID=1043003 RepID=A0A074W748_AURM1